MVVPDALASTQLTDKALERIDTLSRGYKQRLGVAQAILHKPKFLILDEPSNGLDPNQIQHMRGVESPEPVNDENVDQHLLEDLEEGGGGALPQAPDPARPVHVPEGRQDPGVLVLVTNGDGGG